MAAQLSVCWTAEKTGPDTPGSTNPRPQAACCECQLSIDDDANCLLQEGRPRCVCDSCHDGHGQVLDHLWSAGVCCSGLSENNLRLG